MKVNSEDFEVIQFFADHAKPGDTQILTRGRGGHKITLTMSNEKMLIAQIEYTNGGGR